MSSQDEYGKPLAKAQAIMAEQMAKPENIAKASWHEVDPIDLIDALDSNTEALCSARDAETAWRRAANVANFAWMIADRDFPVGDDEPSNLETLVDITVEGTGAIEPVAWP